MTKIIVRLLGRSGELLAWTETHAHARGDGCLWPTEAIQLGIEQRGEAAAISLHWVDVNVERRQDVTPVSVASGQIVPIAWDGPYFVVGPAAGGLPPVTVRGSVVVSLRPARLGAVG